MGSGFAIDHCGATSARREAAILFTEWIFTGCITPVAHLGYITSTSIHHCETPAEVSPCDDHSITRCFVRFIFCRMIPASWAGRGGYDG